MGRNSTPVRFDDDYGAAPDTPPSYLLHICDLLGCAPVPRGMMPPVQSMLPDDVRRDFITALAAWLDSLPDSPQGATIAGRLSKLRDRLVELSADKDTVP